MYNRLAGQMEIQYDTMRYTPKSSMATKFQVWVLWLSSIFSFPRDGFEILGLVIIFFREVRFKRMAKCSFWWMHPWNFLQEQGVPIRISFKHGWICDCHGIIFLDARQEEEAIVVPPCRLDHEHYTKKWLGDDKSNEAFSVFCGAVFVCLVGWLVGCGLVGSGRVGFGLVWFVGCFGLVWFGLFVCWLVVGWLIS